MLTVLHSVANREKREKCLFLPLSNTEDSLVTLRSLRLMSHSEEANGPVCFVFSGIYHFAEHLKQRIEWKTLLKSLQLFSKSSRKPWCSITANQHLRYLWRKKENTKKESERQRMWSHTVDLAAILVLLCEHRNLLVKKIINWVLT